MVGGVAWNEPAGRRQFSEIEELVEIQTAIGLADHRDLQGPLFVFRVQVIGEKSANRRREDGSGKKELLSSLHAPASVRG